MWQSVTRKQLSSQFKCPPNRGKSALILSVHTWHDHQFNCINCDLYPYTMYAVFTQRVISRRKVQSFTLWGISLSFLSFATPPLATWLLAESTIAFVQLKLTLIAVPVVLCTCSRRLRRQNQLNSRKYSEQPSKYGGHMVGRGRRIASPSSFIFV